MTLTLDIRTPIIVLVADFNAAIFNPEWVAEHLFGHKEGDEISTLEIVAQNGANLLPLSFVDGVSVNVGDGRSDIWALNGEPETIERVEAVLLKMLEVLPHTPLTAIGCNVVYSDDDAPKAILEMFDTAEGLEAEGVLSTRHLGVQLQREDHVLNFTRVLTASDARFSFNYHRSESDPAEYAKYVPGLINRCFEHSRAFLKTYYAYEGSTVTGFIAPKVEEGVGENVDAAA